SLRRQRAHTLRVHAPERARDPCRGRRLSALVLEPDAHIELLLQVVPGELACRAHAADDDETGAVRLPHEPWKCRANDRPARVFLEAAPVRLNPRVAGPPVRQVTRLRAEGPGGPPANRKGEGCLRPHSPRIDCTRCARSSMK